MLSQRINFPYKEKILEKKMKEGLEYQLKIIKQKKNIKYIYNINNKNGKGQR